MILRQVIVGFKIAFSGLFFRKQNCARGLQEQRDVNVIVIIALASAKPSLSFLKS